MDTRSHFGSCFAAQAAGPAACCAFGFMARASCGPAGWAKAGAEVVYGRLAIMAIISMFFHDGFTGGAWGDCALHAASPLWAFEYGMGMHYTKGFCDPAGFTAIGSVVNFLRRRLTELEHGRSAMFAAMGYNAPGTTGKLPCFLSPSLGISCECFHDGFTGSAWGDLALHSASPLRAFDYELDTEDTRGFCDPAGFTDGVNVENFQRRRQTELEHGRSAMPFAMGYIAPGITGMLPCFLSPPIGKRESFTGLLGMQ